MLSFVVYAYPNQDKYRLEIKEMASAVDYSRFNPLSPYDFTENPKNLDTGGVSGILRSVTPCPVIIQEINYKTSEDDSKAAIAYLNKIRKQYGKNEISFDKRVFELAVARAKDMRTYNYLDHTNPITGTCPDNMKSAYGINPSEYLAENALGNPEYSEGSCTELISKPMTEAIDSWMESRGHRYNLLYDKHISGAVGCYKNMCAFLGLTHDEFGLGGKGCYAAEEGTKFWSGAEKQPGEIDFGQTGTTQAVAVTQVNTNPSSQQKGTYWKEGVGWVSEGTEYDK